MSRQKRIVRESKIRERGVWEIVERKIKGQSDSGLDDHMRQEEAGEVAVG